MINDRLHPRAGPILINPGTGVVDGAREEYADHNISQLVQDVDLEGITYRKDASKDDGEGRFGYQLTHHQKDVEVQMPGWPLERVRFLGKEGQKIMEFPRLYVDGSSWLWKFAVNIIKDIYEHPDEE